MKATFFEDENGTSTETYDLNHNLSHDYGNADVNLAHYKPIIIIKKPVS